MRASLTSFTRRRPVESGTPGRELTDLERHRVPTGFEAVGEALVSGECPAAASAVAGRTLACDGASLGEALSGLRATYAALGGAAPDFGTTEALCIAWSEAMLEFLHDVSCEDPLTGLASVAHLRTRLSEVYREAERRGESLRLTSALVVVDVTTPGPASAAPFARALRLAAVADALRSVFCGEESLARVGQDRVVALVRRGPDLPEVVSDLRMMLRDLDVAPHARVWIEGLPGDPDLGVRLLSELCR